MLLEERTQAQTIIKKNSVWMVFCGCELWMLSCDKDGYGWAWFNGDTWRAHRLAYTAFLGEIPKGLGVLHICDTPSCVNPNHLYIGTSKNNSEDMVRRGRSSRGDKNGTRLYPEKLLRGNQHWTHLHPEKLARGEKQGHAKLTEEKVRYIFQLRKEGFNQKKIGEILSCKEETVNAILHRRNWKHVMV
jgi:hypothetical protein